MLISLSCSSLQVRVETETEVLFWLGEAVSNRAVNATQQNAESSRSHLILTLARERGGRAATLLLVDLAGSEKVKKTGARASGQHGIPKHAPWRLTRAVLS